MKNLMTRKCVFGVLMACVLAFSVQFTAYGIKTTGDGAFALTAKIGRSHRPISVVSVLD